MAWKYPRQPFGKLSQLEALRKCWLEFTYAAIHVMIQNEFMAIKNVLQPIKIPRLGSRLPREPTAFGMG
jgi:hypothetical protein